MSDRFIGLRYEIYLNQNDKVDTSIFKKLIQTKADDLYCFGWIQDSPKETLVGEARCNKRMGYEMKKFLSSSTNSSHFDHVDIKQYEDTKIKLHFSHFKILDSRRDTCFQDEPHICSRQYTV